MMNGFKVKGNTLVRYCGTADEIILPEVEIIAAEAFKGNNILRSIIMPNTIKIIEKKAFECCYKLESVVLPESITSIGEGAFNNCSSLKSIIINASIEAIPRGFCCFCKELRSIQFPGSIKRIESEAFEGTHIEEVNFPETIEYIGRGAFAHCTALKKISIPNSIKKIDSMAFAYCKYLATSQLSLPESCEVENNAFVGTCVNGYRTVKIAIDYEDDQFEIKKTVEYEFKDDESIEDAIFRILDIADDGQFDDLIDEALASYYPGPKGNFNICDEGTNLYSTARKHIRSVVGSTTIFLRTIDADPVQKFSYKLYDYLSEKIEGRECCENADCDIGGVIEASILDFEAQSTWHISFLTGEGDRILFESDIKPRFDPDNGKWFIGLEEVTPELWYGINGIEPKAPWIISRNIKQDDIDFWFNPDYYYVLWRIIDDCNDAFLTWYLYELRRDCIEIDDVLSKCPLELNKDDSPEDVERKLNELLNRTSGN